MKLINRKRLFNAETISASFVSNEFTVFGSMIPHQIMIDYTKGTELKTTLYIDYRPDNFGIATEWYDGSVFDPTTGVLTPCKAILDTTGMFVFSLPFMGPGYYRLRAVGDTIGLVPGFITAYTSKHTN